MRVRAVIVAIAMASGPALAQEQGTASVAPLAVPAPAASAIPISSKPSGPPMSQRPALRRHMAGISPAMASCRPSAMP